METDDLSVLLVLTRALAHNCCLVLVTLAEVSELARAW